jgi:hypothetical protein
MTLPDFTEFVLETLANVDPPETPIVRYNRRDGVRKDTGARTDGVDLSAGVVVSVGSADGPNEPIGTEYDHRIDHELTVRVEGVHETAGGTVDTGEWRAIKDAVETALTDERNFPTTDINILSLKIPDESDLSDNLGDHYRCDFTVRFEGYEDL